MTGGSSPPGTVHVVGAGLAGLAAALSLSRAGHRVDVHEATGQAGGRCRSFHDPQLGCRIDNGNHLLLSANRAALDYLAEIGASDSLVSGDPAFPFLDLATGSAWTVAFGDGGLLGRMLAPYRQVPGARLREALRLLSLAVAGPRATVMQALGAGPMMERFWRPLTVAILNTEPEKAAAGLLRGVLRELAGGDATPMTVRDGLSDSFVDPALATLERRGARVGFHRRLRALDRSADQVTALHFATETIGLEAGDAIVLALPPSTVADLLPDLSVPTGSSAIVNAHYRLAAPASLPGGAALIGLIGGTAHWVFLRGAIASVTVSAADTLIDEPAEALLATLWGDTAKALGCPAAPQPAGRIVKERRATFRQTPAALSSRPSARTAWSNLFLAGDWTDTGLPATIEGAIRSGRTAAMLAGRQNTHI